MTGNYAVKLSTLKDVLRRHLASNRANVNENGGAAMHRNERHADVLLKSSVLMMAVKRSKYMGVIRAASDTFPRWSRVTGRAPK